MNFLFPGFLFALSAVSIPIIIHLFNFRKFRKIYFSNVQFLKEVEQKTSSGKKLRDRLILATRILAIIFLVLAFAKPYIAGKESVAREQQIVSIYIDNSYSMEAVNKEGSLLDEAKRRAKEIANAYSLNDKFQLVTNDFEGKHQRLLSKEDFINAIDEVKIGGSAKNLRQVINRQIEIVSGKPNTHKVIYLVSDFQKNMLQSETIEPDSAIEVHFIRLKANLLANVSVDSVWFASPIHKPGDSEKLIVQLRNNSDESTDAIPIKLQINGRQKAIGSISLKKRAVGRDTLSFSGLSSGWQQGEIQITDYPVIFDDKFYFTFHVRPNISVLAINERDINPYLQAVYRADPFFNLQHVSSGSVNYSLLNTHELIILDSISDISAGLAQQLQDYVKSGGNLMVFPALTTEFSSLKNLLQGLGTDIPEQIVNAEMRVNSINLRNTFFKNVFEQIPRNIALPVAKKYMQFSNRSRMAKQNLLTLPGGKSFLSQYNLGKGKVYLFAVPLDEEASNLVHHAVFVPLMYQAAFLSLQDNRLFYTLGRDQFLEAHKISLSANQSLKLKRGKFETIPDLQQTENFTRLYIADQVREEGIYQLFKADSLIGVFAFNNDRSESDLSYATNEELETKFQKKKIEILNSGKEPLQNLIKAASWGTRLWKLCLILALIFLAAEILLIRFYKTAQIKG